MRQHHMTLVKLDLECRVGQCFQDYAINLYCFFLGQNLISDNIT